MKKELVDVVLGSGNVFRDLSQENAGVAQFKAILAAEIIKVAGSRRPKRRQTHTRTRIAAADLSRVRNANLDRFTVDG